MATRTPKTSRAQVQPGTGPEKAFGQALREFREARKVSQERLGLEAGFDRTYISLIERGINSPTIRTVVKLAAVLRVQPSGIVGRMETLLEGDGGPDGGGAGGAGAGGKGIDG